MNPDGPFTLVAVDSDAELYRAAFGEYRASATHSEGLFASDGQHGSTQKRIAGSVEHLAQHLHRVPVLLLACISAPGSAVLPDGSAASMWGSLFPAVWSYMLAARARGLGTVWIDLHLRHEQQVAEILDLPDGICQGPLIPTAYTVGHGLPCRSTCTTRRGSTPRPMVKVFVRQRG
jgi:nitroreductase